MQLLFIITIEKKSQNYSITDEEKLKPLMHPCKPICFFYGP